MSSLVNNSKFHSIFKFLSAFNFPCALCFLKVQKHTKNSLTDNKCAPLKTTLYVIKKITEYIVVLSFIAYMWFAKLNDLWYIDRRSQTQAFRRKGKQEGVERKHLVSSVKMLAFLLRKNYSIQFCYSASFLQETKLLWINSTSILATFIAFYKTVHSKEILTLKFMLILNVK